MQPASRLFSAAQSVKLRWWLLVRTQKRAEGALALRHIVLLAVIVCIFFVKLFRTAPSSCPPRSPITSASRSSSILRDDPFYSLPFSYVFVFSTGRSGTQHFSRALTSPSHCNPCAYITHEEEHAVERTKVIVEQVYRRLAAARDESTFNESSRRYLRTVKIPFYKRLAKAHGATRLVYTGHLPLAYGLGPAILSELPRGAVRVVRLRRDRIATALSLMALGPENEDPWGATSRDTQQQPATSINKRWFPKPRDPFTRLEVSEAAWSRLNRFQRWLWYVDDVECRWQAMKVGFSGSFSWIETSIEALSVMDNGSEWRAVADFMGVDVDIEKAFSRHNSIQSKRRIKEPLPEGQARQWDEQYRSLVGPCRLASNVQYQW